MFGTSSAPAACIGAKSSLTISSRCVVLWSNSSSGTNDTCANARAHAHALKHSHKQTRIHKCTHQLASAHIHEHTHMNMQTQTHIRKHTHTRMHTQIYTRTYTHTHTSAFCLSHTHAHTHTHTHVYANTRVQMYGKKVRGIESRSQRTIARKQDATEQERAHKQTRETTKRKHKEREREREMEKWREREKQSKAVIRACQCVQRVIETARIETHDCTGVCRRGAVRDWNLLQEALHSEICH